MILPNSKFHLLPVLALALLLCAADAPAPSLPGADATPDQILESFQAHSKTWTDYTLTMRTKVKRGDKSDNSLLSFSAKPPNYFRSNVIEGKDQGSTVARGKSGKIRAQGGGVLGVIIITMKDDDARLADVRGARLQDAGWDFMVAQFMRRKDQGWTFERLADETLRKEDCFAIQASGPADKLGETREVFLFSKKDMTVRARRLWEGDLLVDDTAYFDIKLNQNLTDEFFDL